MKKKLRSIVVDGIFFQWTVDWSYREYVRILHLRVWGGSKTSCCLHVNLHSKWFVPMTDSSYPTPKDVQRIIIFGLMQGWDVDSEENAFWLKDNENRLQLDDLLVTEYGHNPTAPPPILQMQRNPRIT
jgi:hypothetical protein